MSASGGGLGGGGGGVRRVPDDAMASRGVFVSHASDDAPLAEAFRELIQDVSAGLIPTYSSSSRDPAAGIPYGDDWFNWIESRIRESGNVVALITPESVGRPWILFEAGFGRAIDGVRVFGLRLGTTAEEAYVGPFKAFQNSGSDADELLKLCRQLFDGTACQPRDEMLLMLIGQFREKVEKQFEAAKKVPKKAPPESEAIFKALEEMKSLVSHRPMLALEEYDDMRMMELDHMFHILFKRSRGTVDPAVRATLLLGIAQEAGLGWCAPTVQYALEHPVRLDKLMHGLMREGPVFRRRRTPFPPEMLLEELFQAVREHQERRFRSMRPMREAIDPPELDEDETEELN